ncbi:ATP-binding protein [Stenotrophomonas sp. Ste96]|uniref:AlbA family DNA-binding domain-containing protein n=1 Tax=Stenotrophomonas sp. Ste96 TaxID=2926029 RepID=UPI0021C6B3A4|nr:ATP-binding protein [Stenotrophomonas sp. Ste96]
MELSWVQSLVDNQVQESLYLEFKRGDALSPQNNSKTEMIKDVTALAHASGGHLVYGIEEEPVNDIPAAVRLRPVTDKKLNKDWVTKVITDNTSPSLTDFEVFEFPVDGGRVLVIKVEEASTAHQNLLDYRYHQRVNTVSRCMADFQIRDLMSRRSSPSCEVRVRLERITINRDNHVYRLRVELLNTGMVSMEKWWISIDVPKECLAGLTYPQSELRTHPRFGKVVREVDKGGFDFIRFSWGDPFFDGDRYILHPGQSLDFGSNNDSLHTQAPLPPIVVEFNHRIFRSLVHRAPELQWTLYTNHGQPVSSSVPFEQWCNF